MVVFLRGDHTVNETKLLTLVKASQVRPMQTEELELYFQGPGGFIGPIGMVARPAELLGLWLDADKEKIKKQYPQFIGRDRQSAKRQCRAR